MRKTWAAPGKLTPSAGAVQMVRAVSWLGCAASAVIVMPVMSIGSSRAAIWVTSVVSAGTWIWATTTAVSWRIAENSCTYRPVVVPGRVLRTVLPSRASPMPAWASSRVFSQIQISRSHDGGVDSLAQRAQSVTAGWDPDAQDRLPARPRGFEQGFREFRHPVGGLPEVTGSAQQGHGQDRQHRGEGMPDTLRLTRIADLREHYGQRGDPAEVDLPSLVGDDIGDRMRD